MGFCYSSGRVVGQDNHKNDGTHVAVAELREDGIKAAVQDGCVASRHSLLRPNKVQCVCNGIVLQVLAELVDCDWNTREREAGGVQASDFTKWERWTAVGWRKLTNASTYEVNTVWLQLSEISGRIKRTQTHTKYSYLMNKWNGLKTIQL